ncbi:hypothetical protein BL250_12505 [Erwinia sp. OLTSP20]|uniref:hypothetical protein n=1 Tax=Enterobacterales TaxID=91347 RepID=UPI000C17A28A|nr:MULTISPECIES: hypothetical protein [Enterobacterales]PII85128.1 hypothetical protein BMF91_23920 [Serratia sp. OLFL2]PIJ49353.1 hypothetical protein BV501_13010 [Erwinia sp. OAMSP11]PIJ69747.1 hypothetical protein BK416_13835 [Erwinia sp. OLSSP12]PIJ76231.1 hypothetical protein BLD47_18090 [Erwinia sp. OLCASP19]PIJ76752.1 hypothetical protein BLD46_18315 [Erwinia sp. OLMTSP26]
MVTDNPRTARDALIIELLGDIGAVHDEIKQLPKNLKGSLRESLELIADAVEQAEKTAQELQRETQSNLKAVSELEIEKLNKETRSVIEESFSKAINDEMHKTEKIALNLQDTLQKFPSYFGNQYKKLCYLMAAILVLVIFVCGFGMTALYLQSKSWEQRSVGIFNAYQEQQKIIMTLPDNERNKFRK